MVQQQARIDEEHRSPLPNLYMEASLRFKLSEQDQIGRLVDVELSLFARCLPSA